MSRGFPPVREGQSTAAEARRLRLEYNKLQRRLSTALARGVADTETDSLRGHIERVARELGLIRADSVHAVESKLRVALDLIGDKADETSHKLLSSALSDLHYLAVLSEPAGSSSGARQKPAADGGERTRVKRVLGSEHADG